MSDVPRPLATTERRSAPPRARRHPRDSLPLLHGFALPVLCVLLSSCDSTALSLRDPNTINAQLDPEYIESDADEVTLWMTVSGSDTTSGPRGERVVLEKSLGEGLYLISYRFEADFRLLLTLGRSADAPRGRRSLSMKIRNSRGTFLVRGEFTVL